MNKNPTSDTEELLPEYDLDYSKAKPNPYATRARAALRAKYGDAYADELEQTMQRNYEERMQARNQANAAPDAVCVTLDSDVAQVFQTAEAVNQILRAIIQSMPRNSAFVQVQ